MTQEQETKLAGHIMRLLKVRQVSFPIARTTKGDLWIKYSQDTEGPVVILDAVPLDLEDFNNKELAGLLERYLYTGQLETIIDKTGMGHIDH